MRALSHDATSLDIFVGVFGVECVDCRCGMVPAADQIRLVISGMSGVTETIKGKAHVGPNQSIRPSAT